MALARSVGCARWTCPSRRRHRGACRGPSSATSSAHEGGWVCRCGSGQAARSGGAAWGHSVTGGHAARRPRPAHTRRMGCRCGSGRRARSQGAAWGTRHGWSCCPPSTSADQRTGPQRPPDPTLHRHASRSWALLRAGRSSNRASAVLTCASDGERNPTTAVRQFSADRVDACRPTDSARPWNSPAAKAVLGHPRLPRWTRVGAHDHGVEVARQFHQVHDQTRGVMPGVDPLRALVRQDLQQAPPVAGGVGVGSFRGLGGAGSMARRIMPRVRPPVRGSAPSPHRASRRDPVEPHAALPVRRTRARGADPSIASARSQRRWRRCASSSLTTHGYRPRCA